MEIRLCTDCGHWSERGKTRCGRCGGAITLADEVSLLGQELGRYRLQSVIGCGGMGIVFAAEHLGLGREVAIKALLPELDHADIIERFQREARLLAGLRHPHIIEIFDFDISSQGMPFYVMERLHGLSFGQALARVGRPLRLTELSLVFVSVARALDYAHRQQIIHRDLKPENVYLAHGELSTVVKLLDFGIAKRLTKDNQQSRLTETGAVLGTPLYLSPEQLADEPLGPASDQFALGLMFAECLIGAPVRGQQSPTQMLRLAMQGDVLDAGQWQAIPDACRAALRRALAFAPDARFPNCLMFIEALELEREPIDTAWIESLGLGQSRLVPTPAPATTALDRLPDADDNRPMALTTPAPAVTRAPTPVTRQSQGPNATVVAAKAQARPRRWWLALTGMLVLAVFVGWYGWSRSGTGDAPWTQGAVQVRPGPSLTLPADAGYLVGLLDAEAYFESSNGHYVLSLDDDLPISAVPSSERILGASEQDELFVQQGNTVSLRAPRGGDQKTLATVPDDASWIRLDPEGTWLAYVQGDAVHWFATKSPAAVRSHPLLRASVQFMAVRDGQLLLARYQPNDVLILELATGETRFSTRTDVNRVFDMAWQPTLNRLAICGFSPIVEIFDLTRPDRPVRLTVPTQCQAALWIPEGPTLLLRADRSLVRWSEQAQATMPWPGKVGSAGAILARFVARDGRVWLYEPELHRLQQIELGPEHLQTLNAPTGVEPWDLAVGQDAVYLGLSNGLLVAIEPQGTRTLSVHDAGITDLIDAGDRLASASDDRTLAVWKKPELSVAWRSRGHDFLVNQLWLAPDQQRLWSSSSDGLAKQWRWPDLEPMQQLDLSALCGHPRTSLHAVWLNAAQDRALFGTWDRRLLWLKRDGDLWQCKSFDVASGGGYRLLEVPAVRAVLLEGTEPSRLYAFDLDTERLSRLPDLGFDLLGLSRSPRPDTALAAGLQSVLLIRGTRNADQTLNWQLEPRMLHGLGRGYAADYAPAQHGFVVADDQGQVKVVPLTLFPGLFETTAENAP
ncbi:hypothetical protein C7S18_17980 [Ahniella affigens]|uniref:Protein kinase domain-containing protein n=1 Tax=Ahniella affigens TaxID=2021234 RepID=A0A2P1PVR6_9GAMM|nr:WD40 repeat domain-containing serine/threonine protein kinase [Ahniella affigens]AVP98947.1 hypothetical protein C7S18_17980 [Ahniella affigens]